MKDVVNSLSKETEKLIEKIYTKVFNKVYSSHRISRLAKGERVEILRMVEMLESSDVYNKFAKRFAKELAKKGIKRQRGLWRKYYQAAKKLRHIALPPTYARWEYEIMSKAAKNNFTMIKSIPRETMNTSYK